MVDFDFRLLLRTLAVDAADAAIIAICLNRLQYGGRKPSKCLYGRYIDRLCYMGVQ